MKVDNIHNVALPDPSELQHLIVVEQAKKTTSIPDADEPEPDMSFSDEDDDETGYCDENDYSDDEYNYDYDDDGNRYDGSY